MQPAPDAVGEFKVVTNNMSAEYGRSAGATINVAYASGTNTYRGSAWEFMRRTELNATGFFRPATGVKPGFDRDQFGGVLGGPIKKNKAFFFADFEMFDQTRSQTASSTIATMAQRAGMLAVDVRNPLTGEVYPAGTPIPMTAFARKVLERSAGADQLGHREQPADPAGVHQPHAEGRRQGRHPDQPAPVGVRPRRLARRRHLRQPADLRTVGRRRQRARPTCTNKQFSSGLTYTPGGTSLLEARFGWSTTKAGKNPTALVRGEPPRGRGLRHHGTADRSARRRRPADAADHRLFGSRPPGDQPAVAVPDRVQSEDQLHLAAGPSLAQDRLRVPARADRSAGRQSALRPRFIRRPVLDVRSATAAANNLYNLADFMFGARSTYALSNILVAELQQNMHFIYLQDDWRVNDRLTINAGLRYEYATPWTEANNVLSNFDPATKTMVMAKDGSLAGSVDAEARSQQLRPAPRHGLHARGSHRDPRRLRHQLRALPSRRRRQRAADQRPAGDQRRRRADARRRARSGRRSRATRRA